MIKRTVALALLVAAASLPLTAAEAGPREKLQKLASKAKVVAAVGVHKSECAVRKLLNKPVGFAC